MFINPLQNSNLFITPTSVEQLTEIADSMSNSSEAWRMMVFTMNYCHQLVEEQELIITEDDLASAVKQACIEMDADMYMRAELEQLMRL